MLFPTRRRHDPKPKVQETGQRTTPDSTHAAHFARLISVRSDLTRHRCTADSMQDRNTNDAGSRDGLNLLPTGFRYWYELQKSQLDPEAIRYVDNLLAQPG